MIPKIINFQLLIILTLFRFVFLIIRQFLGDIREDRGQRYILWSLIALIPFLVVYAEKTTYKGNYIDPVVKILSDQEILIKTLRDENEELKELLKDLEGLYRGDRKSVIAYIRLKFKEDARLAQAIFMAESGLNCNRVQDYMNKDGSVDYGVAQINSVHAGRVGGNLERLLDCKTNIDVAHQIYMEQGFAPWVAYRNGGYLKYY